jgi:hypothetical protein
MFFFLAYLTMFFGIFMAGISGLFPASVQNVIPDMYRSFFFIMGLIVAMIGLVLLNIRAIKVGANHLIAPGRPDSILWLYVFRDGTIKIVPSLRVVEGQLYSPELDAQIHEMKSYRIFDHSIRFVPEGVGHAIDLDMCLYAYVLKTKWGFSNLLQARKGVLKKTEPLPSQEHTITGKELSAITTQEVEQVGKK